MRPARELEILPLRLAGAAPALAALADRALLEAWESTVAAFLDRGSLERRAIEADLVRTTRLSTPGLQAGLEAVLGGVRGAPLTRLFEEAREMRARPHIVSPAGFSLVILASNLPALAVQPLVAALAARRPVLLKSPTAEPVFAPAFVDALVRRLPALDEAVAAVTWPGGSVALEEPLLTRAGVVVAYGDAPALADLEARVKRLGRARLVPYGPKTSLAVVGSDAADSDLERTAAGLARDVALFDQRGCLSVAAVYVEEEGRHDARRARALADALAAELRTLERRWPPGPEGGPEGGRLDPADAGAVQQVRAEADLRGLFRPALELGEGTVVVEPDPAMRATPGLRTVRVHPIDDLGAIEAILAPWNGRLQGAALAGASAEALAPALARLGVSRTAPPGDLQSPDALWHNGGEHPLTAFV